MKVSFFYLLGFPAVVTIRLSLVVSVLLVVLVFSVCAKYSHVCISESVNWTKNKNRTRLKTL